MPKAKKTSTKRHCHGRLRARAVGMADAVRGAMDAAAEYKREKPGPGTFPPAPTG